MVDNQAFISASHLQSAVAPVVCPHCGAMMRLSHITPGADGSYQETITFECQCGALHHQSVRLRRRA